MQRFVICMLVLLCGCAFEEVRCCGGQVNISTSNPSVYIQSDNYPNRYNHGQDCTWVLPYTPGYMIDLQFTDIALQHHSDCGYDYVKITSDEGVVGQFCDNSSIVMAPATGFLVRFVSDFATRDRGFQMLAKLIDVTECSANNALCEQKCTNTQGSFECSCYDGFQEINTKCMDVNECTKSNGGCEHDCTNTEGSFQCTCRHGYFVSGTKCLDVDECSDKNGGCDQICVNTKGSHNCSCIPGFVLEGNTCREECPDQYCNHHGMCEMAGNSKTCSCFDGWQGLNCEKEESAKFAAAKTETAPVVVLGVFLAIVCLLLVCLGLLHFRYRRSQGSSQMQGKNGLENPVYFEKNGAL